MGIFKFLKTKKGQKEETGQLPQPDLSQLPPLPSDSELYSELPSLPDAPETQDTELPQQLKGLEELELPDTFGGAMPSGRQEEEQPMPAWQENTREELTEVDLNILKSEAEKSSREWEAPEKLPELMPFSSGRGTGLINRNNAFFLRANDFKTVVEGLDEVAKTQRKHHRLTEIKKEENAHYEHLSVVAEDIQRRLMHIDRTLFEQ